MKYKAIYKCRLCGENFCSGMTGSKSVAMSNLFHMICGAPIDKKIIGNPITETDLHDCEDGSCGIADFQGFKAESENPWEKLSRMLNEIED